MNTCFHIFPQLTRKDPWRLKSGAAGAERGWWWWWWWWWRRRWRCCCCWGCGDELVLIGGLECQGFHCRDRGAWWRVGGPGRGGTFWFRLRTWTLSAKNSLVSGQKTWKCCRSWIWANSPTYSPKWECFLCLISPTTSCPSSTWSMSQVRKKTPSVCLKWECFQLESLLSIGLSLKDSTCYGGRFALLPTRALNMHLFTSAQSRNIFLHNFKFKPLQWSLSKMNRADLWATFAHFENPHRGFLICFAPSPYKAKPVT